MVCIDNSCEANLTPNYTHTYNASHNTWYKLRVDADSITGDLAVYVNDIHIFDYSAVTPNRSGRSGLHCGNAGGYFDDFRVTSNDIPSNPVTIDIKPGADTNTINLGSKGSVPVAILTTADFDASTVDPTTVTLADAPAIKRKMMDVDDDGDMDLLLYFSTQALNLDESSTEAILKGKTDAEFGVIDIIGTDSVSIVRKGKK